MQPICFQNAKLRSAWRFWLLFKQGLFALKTRLVYNANKASLQCKEALFENEAIVHFVSVWRALGVYCRSVPKKKPASDGGCGLFRWYMCLGRYLATVTLCTSPPTFTT